MRMYRMRRSLALEVDVSLSVLLGTLSVSCSWPTENGEALAEVGWGSDDDHSSSVM
jgi:hypothetical protein